MFTLPEHTVKKTSNIVAGIIVTMIIYGISTIFTAVVMMLAQVSGAMFVLRLGCFTTLAAAVAIMILSAISS